MTELITGFSMVKTYRRCPKAYEYKYVRNLQKKKPAPPLIRGTILHELLNSRALRAMKRPARPARSILADYEKQYGSLFREEQEVYGEDFLPNIGRVWEGYERTYINDGWKYEGTEEEIETQLTPTIKYHGTLDKRVVTQKDGRRWICDHKTHKTIPDEEQRFSNFQILFYLWAWNREHPQEPADGIIWDYLRTKPPTIPEQLKNGQLTQRANLDTDYETYAKELRRLRLDPKPYEIYLQELKKRSVGKFYQRIFLPAPSKELTENVVRDFTQTSQIMHGLKVYPRNTTRDCSWCEFYRLCGAELRGLDYKFIEKTEFIEQTVKEEFSEES
jgi:RecB family exonuclease